MVTYSIYPAIGVARLGNSTDPDGFFLAPDAIGALPKDCNSVTYEDSTTFRGFRGDDNQIRRQAQKFRIYDDSNNEITVGSTIEDGTGLVTKLEWTVHLANKKAEWYGFEEQKGNLLYGPNNSYASHEMYPRNIEPIETINNDGNPQTIDPPEDRHELFIDPGPRTIDSERGGIVPIDNNYTGGYPGHFPPTRAEVEAENLTFQGSQIDVLGELRIDSSGRLLVLGGKGHSQGKISLDSYGGADTWYDDISDGSVTCTIHIHTGQSFEVTGKAWVIVGPPDFAPELVNIASWDDTIFDIAVRERNLLGIYNEANFSDPDPSINGFNPDFHVNYQRDILPIIKRIAGYQWVANVQSMSAFFSDFNDLDPENPADSGEFLAKRQEFFSYFQPPIPQEQITDGNYSAQYDLFENPNNPTIPKMPLNSGSNSVSNYNIKKFMALTRTQYFFLRQWAHGICTSDSSTELYSFADPKNRASVGNVVGLPQCPGIEVTWTTQNKVIYDTDVYRIKHHATSDDFYKNQGGLSITRDECEGGGCEPGDLTKRMAIPWQADFFNCTIQHVNFNDPDVNKYDPDHDFAPTPPSEWPRDTLIPKPPTYYAYWWPPQAPWDVLVGEHTEADQAAAGDLSAGLQVNYMRGINSYSQMVNGGWSYLGFIRNQNADASGYYPYFVETERDHHMFKVTDIGAGTAKQAEIIFEDLNSEDPKITTIDQIKNLFSLREEDNETTMKVFSMKKFKERQETKASRFKALNLEFVEDLFREIKIADSHKRRPPRSGSKVRF